MARVPAAVLHALAEVMNRIRSAPRALARRHRRSHAPAAAPELAARSHPWTRAVGLVAVVLLGAWLGLLVVGNVRVPVGPMNTTMTLRPSLSGGTKINVSPLGALRLDSHVAPVRLDVNVDQLDPARAEALVDHPERLSGLQDEVAHDVGHGTLDLAVRSCAAVVTGATALGLVVYRRPRRALGAGGLALTLLLASGGTAYATWNPDSVLEPKFSGLLSSAPSLVGNARSIVTEFDVYQQELARLVTNVTKLYDVTSTLPAYQPDPTTIRVLHVSDIHLNPASWKIIASLVEQYKVNVIVDSGDTMDHGTAAENGFLDPVEDLGAPYVWVRGNHDSRGTQEYLRHLKNAHVLDDGRARTVAGLRFAGIGDPQYTPDRSKADGAEASQELAGARLASALRDQTAAGTPVDVAVAHEPSAAREVDGAVPLVLSGHLHHEDMEVMKYGTRLRIEGSTGGSGLRAVEGEHPDPLQTSVLYFDRDTRRLQAWDQIKLGGLGLTTAEVSRHLPKENQPGATPSPSATSPSPALSPSTPGTPAPSTP
ncbi:metallophosphoesterase [Streptomyces olivaceus]|uniref:Metallophosphoesterase n=1 Tax=Streptomyces olivaceus TaxID=47716 RepID=A0ABS7WEJ5_STROV|nr:metallophosphoesterase [Streptomyces olivaceus]MBZ6093551.1 metallophosphoesterase [Streptomyces olivaceus]MBZ6100618.1 metallophosphoesterase [Streptomyces olivaceus]MBZ6121749.1 metallophosphoesterase [Streptomyces olivaceus]MBZ6156383.1 metallophosphoesterase [Streptomyces olivaceus]MBZ6283565.1 metallophosphoesterase [Streptomyces olivaceus]